MERPCFRAFSFIEGRFRSPAVHGRTILPPAMAAASAISLAATLFGGLTYVENSPNLLIRAMAESRHVPAPRFLAYLIKYVLPT